MRHSASFILAGLLALTAGCGADGGRAGGGADGPPARFVFVTHGQPSDPFWSVVSNGARRAGDDLGVRVEYQAPTSFDMVQMSQLIEAAIASRPAGLVVSIPDADALAASIRAAVAAGIPVVSINSGGPWSRSLGALVHIGQTEYEAGQAGGERMAAAGVRRALCVNHEVGNAALDERCAGVRDALREVSGSASVVAVDLADPDDTQQRIAGALANDAAVDGIITLGPAAADPTLAALDASGRVGTVAYATFDLTTAVIEAVRDGRALFAIDQQQYLQGYLPVVLLANYLVTGTMPGGGEVVRTGPGFVTAENAGRVLELTRRGLR